MLGFQIPLFSESRIRRNNFAYVEALWSRWSPGWTPPPERIQAIKETLSADGVLTAALNYYRSVRPGLSGHRRKAWQLLNTAPKHPVTCLVGARDGCIAPDVFEYVDFPVTIVPNAGHFVPLEAPGAIIEHVLNT